MKKALLALLVGPSVMFAVGFAMNALVMALNGSQMPVHVFANDCSVIDPQDFIHSCMTSATHLKILADWVVIKNIGIASPGDFLEWGSDLLQVPCYAAAFTLATKKLFFDKA